MTMQASCELCLKSAEEPEVPAADGMIFHSKKFHVVLVDDAAYPGFCRVIWNDHVKEMTDLEEGDRALLMDVLWQVEAAVREVMRPDKINLASLGNVVPHLHWHIIPRYLDDAHFPNPVWAEAQRAPSGLAPRIALLPRLSRTIVERIGLYGQYDGSGAA